MSCSLSEACFAGIQYASRRVASLRGANSHLCFAGEEKRGRKREDAEPARVGEGGDSGVREGGGTTAWARGSRRAKRIPERRACLSSHVFAHTHSFVRSQRRSTSSPSATDHPPRAPLVYGSRLAYCARQAQPVLECSTTATLSNDSSRVRLPGRSRLPRSNAASESPGARRSREAMPRRALNH